MPRFWTVFSGWFGTLILFWVLANLIGLVKPMGLKPFRQTGFPFTVAAWGIGIEESFDWQALGLNALIALGISALLAWACATYRLRQASARYPMSGTEPGAAPDRRV